jgi:hypothetical protein
MPGSFGVRLTGAVNVTRDGVAVLAHDNGGRAAPALDGKRHDNPIRQLWPPTEAAGLILEIERSAWDDFETGLAHLVN